MKTVLLNFVAAMLLATGVIFFSFVIVMYPLLRLYHLVLGKYPFGLEINGEQ